MLFAMLLAAVPAHAQSSSSSFSFTPVFVPTLANRTYFARDVYHDIDTTMARAQRDDWNRPVVDLLKVKGYSVYEQAINNIGYASTGPEHQIWEGAVNVSEIKGLNKGSIGAAMELASWSSRQIGVIYAEPVGHNAFDEHTVFFGWGGANLTVDGFVMELRDEADAYDDVDDMFASIEVEYPEEWDTAVYGVQSLKYRDMPASAVPFQDNANSVFTFEVFQSLDDLVTPVGYYLMERRWLNGKHKYVNHWAFTPDFVKIGYQDDHTDLAIVVSVPGPGTVDAWLQALNALPVPPTVYSQVPGHSFEALFGLVGP